MALPTAEKTYVKNNRGLIAVLLLSACATGYQNNGFAGAIPKIQLAPYSSRPDCKRRI